MLLSKHGSWNKRSDYTSHDSEPGAVDKEACSEIGFENDL